MTSVFLHYAVHCGELYKTIFQVKIPYEINFLIKRMLYNIYSFVILIDFFIIFIL